MEQDLFDVLTGLEMEAETERLRGGSAQILDLNAARLLAVLAVSNKAKTIVEVGAGTGYSTLWLAHAAIRTGGRVISCEIDPAKAAQAQANLQKAGVAGVVELLSGDARDLLRGRDEAVDFLFINGQNSQYETYFDVVYKQMGVGALVVANGVVAHQDELADYTTYVQNHPNLESVTVPLGEGLELTVKTGE